MMANTISSESGNAASPSTHGRDSLPIQLATMGARMAISQDADAPENEIRQIAFQHLDPLFYPDSESDEVFVEFVRKGKTWSIDSIEIKHGLEHEFAFQWVMSDFKCDSSKTDIGERIAGSFECRGCADYVILTEAQRWLVILRPRSERSYTG